MRIRIETYRLCRKMGLYSAWTTAEIIKLVGRNRESVMRKLHNLTDAKYMEKKRSCSGYFYWRVREYPPRPVAKKLWREPKSIYELSRDE